LSQMSSYYLGFCFLEEKNQDAAKLAFKKSALGKGSIHPKVKEDALYQYAKLAFATTDYDESLKALALLRKKYPNAAYMDEVRAMTGEIYLFTRDYKNSIQFFESTPLNTPRSRKAYQTVCYFYGLELFEVPKYDLAVKYLQKAVDNNYDVTMGQNALYWIGEATFRKGDFPGARKSYLAFIRSRNASSNPNFAKAYYGIGWTYFKQKSYNEALKGFDDFLKNGGQKADKNLVVDAYLRAGDCLFITKKFSKANTYYQKVLGRKYTYRDYAAYQMAESFYRQSRYQESVTTFGKMIRSFKSSEYRPNALDRISDIYANWIKDYNNAAKYSKMLVEEYPRSTLAAGAYNRLAQASYNQGNSNQAVKYFKKVLSDYGNDKKNAQIALDNLSNLLPEKQFDKVLADFKKKNPDTDDNFGTLVFNTGKDRFFASNYSSAIQQFSTYIKDYKNGPNYFEALIFRARSYTESAQSSKALADYRQVYSAPVNNNFTGVALQEAGEIQYEQKEYINSLQLFQQLETNSNSLPNKVQAWFGVAKNYKAMADYGPAIDALSQISNNNEVQAYSRTKASVEIGHCQYLNGELDAAYLSFSNVEQEYKNAFGAESQHMITQILFDQGKELQSQGDPDAANARFEEVKAATIYQKNNYPTFNYWKAKTFFIAANAYYELGNSFQAKGTLESLVAEPRFPDVQEAAKKRLAEIEAAEAAEDDAAGN
ncbi:MAG: tetratricopeptide repeat protein, partial [Bacteroidota bacterium]